MEIWTIFNTYGLIAREENGVCSLSIYIYVICVLEQPLSRHQACCCLSRLEDGPKIVRDSPGRIAATQQLFVALLMEMHLMSACRRARASRPCELVSPDGGAAKPEEHSSSCAGVSVTQQFASPHSWRTSRVHLEANPGSPG
jgi:hypothetical protein